jgi:hypothetical protein
MDACGAPSLAITSVYVAGAAALVGEGEEDMLGEGRGDSGVVGVEEGVGEQSRRHNAPSQVG